METTVFARDESIVGARQHHRSDDAGRCEMKFIPDGWSVDVDGNKVLVTFPAGDLQEGGS